MALPSSPAASAPASAGERWPPLESSPEVFNQFMWSLGVREDEAEFHDVYGLDADALDMVPQPVLAVILCFPDPPQDASYPSDLLLSYGEKRALFLEKDDAMAKAHSLAASAGVTELCDVVEEHYICFVAVNGTLNELDGMKEGPIKHGSSCSKSFLQDAVPVIKGIMRNIPDSISFNLMVLSRKQNNAGSAS
ncbi:ubiquitin carboxyl-terminal hydrolase isozyme L3-like isoform X2 [Panicum miliaceum]|uniref:Ubiquitin carboxyl-terminal hydrolase n=1 Tax=Panicum miliaceum TaxID=4540 RepID=A0A3L6QC23_PANMI|nr:ubiquitin carboxyl-terminal hydrolase isozyme L3-like isoform X2 [Panicum miliaceum]